MLMLKLSLVFIGIWQYYKNTSLSKDKEAYPKVAELDPFVKPNCVIEIHLLCEVALGELLTAMVECALNLKPYRCHLKELGTKLVDL